MSRAYLIIAALLALIGTAALSGWLSFRAGSLIKQGEWDASIVASKAGEARALKAAAEAIAKIEVKSEQYIQPIRTEIRTNTVYADCKHSADSLRNLNALILGTEPVDQVVVPRGNPAD